MIYKSRILRILWHVQALTKLHDRDNRDNKEDGTANYTLFVLIGALGLGCAPPYYYDGTVLVAVLGLPARIGFMLFSCVN